MYMYYTYIVRCGLVYCMQGYNAPINDMPHLPRPEAGGDKGGDSIGRRVPSGGRFDLSVYYNFTVSIFLYAYFGPF